LEGEGVRASTPESGVSAVSRRPLLLAAILAVSFPVAVSGQTESDFYALPKTVPEFWRAVQFEIRTGNFERADERLKGLLDLNPDSKTLFDLVDKPPPGTQGGMSQFLRLRNVPRWHANANRDKEAKQRVEDLIARLTKAVEAELSNPERIRRFANALAGPAEESTFALRELRRSGKAAPPVLATMLLERPADDVRSAILGAIPLLSIDTVPGFVAFLPAADTASQSDLIDALRRRTDYRTLSLNADTDPVPTLWYLAGSETTSELVKKKARDAIAAATLKDPSLERDPELRTPQGQLTAYAQRFHEGTSNLAKLAGDAKNEAAHNVWIWDGKTLKEVALTRAQATEHYGLRYARWALDIQPDYAPAQRMFLSIAIEHHAMRAGGGAHLVRTSPELHAALATAPFDLLSDLLEEAIRNKKTAVVLAVVRVLGERTEAKAARPSGKPGPKAGGDQGVRPALMVKALDYPDPRVQFAAADALLRVPGPHTHGRNTQIVKILAETLAAAPPEGAKQKVLLGDPDSVRAEAVASVLHRVGFDVDTVRTGRDLMRRLHEKADVDLVLVDRHLPDPLLPNLLPQLRADQRSKTLPVMVVASPDGIAPVNLLTAIARLAAVVAFEDLLENPYIDFAPNRADAVDRVQHSPEEMQRLLVGRHTAQVQRMQAAVDKAGFVLTEELKDRIEYFSLQTFSPDILNTYARQLVDLERIVVRRLLPPLALAEAGDAPTSALKSKIRADELPSLEESQRIVNLMKLTAGFESGLQNDRLTAFEKLWDSFWNPEAPRLPQMAPIRDPEAEARVIRTVAPYRGVLVIPAIFTDAGFKDALVQATDPAAPLMTPEEKKENAKAAMSWLRKMATGEISGYRFADAEPAIRKALQSDDLAPMALDALVHIPSRDAQLDIANLAVAPERPVPIRTQAATALVEHIQTYGKFVTVPQAEAIVTSAAAAEDGALKARLLAAQGVLKSDAKTTGSRLKQYVPKPVEMKEDVPPPKKEPEEKKD
jgi:CheY-like chemotaxis protein